MFEFTEADFLRQVVRTDVLEETIEEALDLLSGDADVQSAINVLRAVL